MASDLHTVLYICDQLALGERLTYKKMFGEYGLYLDGKVVAFVCDDQLFLKPTQAGRQFLGAVQLAAPYPGAKDYFLLDAELEDPERLRTALAVTAEAIPAKPKRPRAKKTTARR